MNASQAYQYSDTHNKLMDTDELMSVTTLANYGTFCEHYSYWQQLAQPASIVMPFPMEKTVPFRKGSSKKRRLSDKELQEIKLKRMLRNRESAARSRARKLAYIKELQNKICQLEEVIKRLGGNKELNTMEWPSVPQEATTSRLQRTNSAPL